MHFLGRADSQIKSRGYRIELGEIEGALNAIDGVRECAVVGVDSTASRERRSAPPTRRRRSARAARASARASAALPAYMLPARWLALDVLPKNQNGKIDRPALRERFASRAGPARGRPDGQTTALRSRSPSPPRRAAGRGAVRRHRPDRRRPARLAGARDAHRRDRAGLRIELPLDELDVESFRSIERIAELVASRSASERAA